MELRRDRTLSLAPQLPTRPVSSSPRSRRSSIAAIFSKLYLGDPGPSDGSVVTTNSPVNKRRVFMGRKWLPPPLRKLSAAKVEKNQTPERPPLKKTPSDKRFKSPTSESKPAEDATGQNGDEGDEEVLELPPPMKPISEPLLVPTSEDAQAQRSSTLSLEGATSADLAEIEQIVKERMEQHSEKTSQLTPVKSPPESVPPADTKESALLKRKYVIQELIDTERDYVRDLSLVVEGYMELMRDPECPVTMPEDLRGGKDKMVFGNLEAIFEWHRDSFLKGLEKCLDHPEEIGRLFKRYERKLLMYVVYCQNKPVSEYIVSEYDSYFEEIRQKLGHKLQLCDLLIKPVQRIMKYQLLLRDIYKYTERAGLSIEIETLREAIGVMQVVPKAANDMMDVGRLQGFDGKITAQGKLLLHGTLQCAEGTSTTNFKGKDLVVFLFEQNIIFSEAVGKKTQFTNPVYIYKAHIQVNKMSLEEGTPSRDKEDSNNDVFIVKSTDPKKPNVGFTCLAPTPELRTEWLSKLRGILQTQRDFLKAIQSPIAYQKELTKEPPYGLREPSPPLECPEVLVSQAHCKRQSLLGGFRATLRRARSEVPSRQSPHLRRWSDSSSSSSDDEAQPAHNSPNRPRSWIFEEDPLYRRYRQLHLIGVGKYSEVYAGEDVVTSQEVALKIVDRRKALGEEGAREEYRRLSALCHRNIVSGLAFFRSSPQPHLDTIVITRVNGIQIFENISHKQISEGELKLYFQQLLSALDYLLTKDIVHADIKPENVLVDNGGIVRLIDFGKSHPDPEFSAPEVNSSNLSPAADMWSLGVLVYAALSGVSPFLDDCPEETFTNKCNANFSFPPEYFGCTPDSALSFISHVLIPDPLQRPVPNSLNNHPWFLQDESEWVAPAERLRNFIFRRRKSSYSGL